MTDKHIINEQEIISDLITFLIKDKDELYNCLKNISENSGLKDKIEKVKKDRNKISY